MIFCRQILGSGMEGMEYRIDTTAQLSAHLRALR
jgi:hypothetical protein